MAVLLPSALRATGTYNADFRLNPGARGCIVTATITAKGAGASTLNLTLQYYDEAAAAYVALLDAVAAPVTLAAQAVAPTEQFTLSAYPSFGIAAPAAGKRRLWSAAVPSGSLRCVAAVATDTITFSLASKSMY